jgi:hypothetical protein
MQFLFYRKRTDIFIGYTNAWMLLREIMFISDNHKKHKELQPVSKMQVF